MFSEMYELVENGYTVGFNNCFIYKSGGKYIVDNTKQRNPTSAWVYSAYPDFQDAYEEFMRRIK